MKRFLSCMTLGACLLVGACHRGQTATPVEPERAPGLLINRNWVDVLPRKKNDRLHVYRFTPAMGGGVYQDRTVFKGTFELFTFEATQTQIRFFLPHEGQRQATSYRIEKLRRDDGDRDAPDLRLTLDASPRGPSVYYGWSDERSAVEARLVPPLP